MTDQREDVKAAVREAVGPVCEERDQLRTRVAKLEDALRHCELLAFTGLQTAVTRGDDDGQRRAAFFRDIRETVRGALAPAPIVTANREPEPCPDDGCRHGYDDWPVGSVTQRDLEFDQCPACGWTAAERAARASDK